VPRKGTDQINTVNSARLRALTQKEAGEEKDALVMRSYYPLQEHLDGFDVCRSIQLSYRRKK
jgi:hypothetical protein